MLLCFPSVVIVDIRVTGKSHYTAAANAAIGNNVTRTQQALRWQKFSLFQGYFQILRFAQSCAYVVVSTTRSGLHTPEIIFVVSSSSNDSGMLLVNPRKLLLGYVTPFVVCGPILLSKLLCN